MGKEGEYKLLGSNNQIVYKIDQASTGIDATYEVVRKFGRATVGTSFSPIAIGGIYRTPQSTSPQRLRIKAGDVNDASGGTGAWTVRLFGLDDSFAEASADLNTDGSTASSPTSTFFTRLYRAKVIRSGTYADASTGSHAADITIEASGGSQDWLTIDSTNFPQGQSEVGAYSIPSGKVAYIDELNIAVATSKVAAVVGFVRENIDQVVVPYDAMRAFSSNTGLVGATPIPFEFGPFVGPCDFGFMGLVTATTGEVSVSFKIKIYG